MHELSQRYKENQKEIMGANPGSSNVIPIQLKITSKSPRKGANATFRFDLNG